MIYLDSNVFIYARVDKGETGDLCRKIIQTIEGGNIVGITSLLTIDEVVWVVKREINYREAIAYARRLLSSGINFIEIKVEEILKSLDLMESGLKPRDAIHSAACLNHGIFSIVTDDADFKKVKGLEAFSLREFLNKHRR